jgi:hypothetical protein
MSGLIRNVVKLFDFSVMYETKSKVWDREGQYPLELSLNQFSLGGMSYREGNTIKFYTPHRPYKRRRKFHG